MKCGTTRYGAVRCGITRYLRCGAVRYNTVRRASLPCRRLRPSVELVPTCRLAQDTTTFPFCFCCARYTGHKSLFILPQLGVGSAIHPPSLCVSVKSLFIARSLPVRVRFYTTNLDQRTYAFCPRTHNKRTSLPPAATPADTVQRSNQTSHIIGVHKRLDAPNPPRAPSICITEKHHQAKQAPATSNPIPLHPRAFPMYAPRRGTNPHTLSPTPRRKNAPLHALNIEWVSEKKGVAEGKRLQRKKAATSHDLPLSTSNQASTTLD